jgi:hypothetical protein
MSKNAFHRKRSLAQYCNRHCAKQTKNLIIIGTPILMRHGFEVGKIHYEGHWNGWALDLDIDTFLGPEIATRDCVGEEGAGGGGDQAGGGGEGGALQQHEQDGAIQDHQPG